MMLCRHCAKPLEHTFVDLGFAPPSNDYIAAADLKRPEKHYPLTVKVCDRCWLVQTEDYAQADELFRSDYAYFSSTSTSWVAHAARYAARMVADLALTSSSLVVEVASNDGYLLKNFVEAGVPCLGIEPTAGTAAAAELLDIPVLRQFFGEATAKALVAEGRQADLVAGNNVYAHVPDINDFTRSLAIILKPNGVVTLEFPHLMRLVESCQFDTVYHEHFSYLSLVAVQRIFAAAGLRVFKVEELLTHGGSLRVFGCRSDAIHETTASVAALLGEERKRGMETTAYYLGFQPRANAVKDGLLRFLLDAKAQGKSVAGYGAAAKGNTLLNYAGVRPDLLPFVCDAAKAKQNTFLPGSHIPVLAPQALTEHRPDYVIILPWNIADEVREQLAPLAALGTRFVTAVPALRVA